MIVVTVFLTILNQMEIHLIQNREENCHHDDIPFNVKGNGNIVFSVWQVFANRMNSRTGWEKLAAKTSTRSSHSHCYPGKLSPFLRHFCHDIIVLFLLKYLRKCVRLLWHRWLYFWSGKFFFQHCYTTNVLHLIEAILANYIR